MQNFELLVVFNIDWFLDNEADDGMIRRKYYRAELFAWEITLQLSNIFPFVVNLSNHNKPRLNAVGKKQSIKIVLFDVLNGPIMPRFSLL